MTNNKEEKLLIGSDLDSMISGLPQKTMCFDTNKQTRHLAMNNEGSASILRSSP